MVGSTLGSGTELHRARGVTLMARCGASRYRGQICSRRLLGFGATPCRLVSLIHTCVGPYDRARDVRNASDMKVNRMSLALAALGQRAAMASELAGFGRNFRADINPTVGKNLKSDGGGSLVTFLCRWFLITPAVRPPCVYPQVRVHVSMNSYLRCISRLVSPWEPYTRRVCPL